MGDFFKDQIITYMGNKRKFIPYINELVNFIENEGGILTNTVSKNTDLLVIKDNSVMDTSKVVKAKELGIKILTKDKI